MHSKSKEADQSYGRSREIASNVGLEAVETTLLTPVHNTKAFTSRSERIQRFIQEEAAEFMAKRYANVYVWPASDDPTWIMGFYSLSQFIIEKAELINRHDRHAIKGIPVPMALIGFMGRAPEAPKGFGATLVLDAARRMAQAPQPLPSWGLALHPENEALAKYYESLGFVRGKVWTKDNGKRLVMYAPLTQLLPTPDQMR